MTVHRPIHQCTYFHSEKDNSDRYMHIPVHPIILRQSLMLATCSSHWCQVTVLAMHIPIHPGTHHRWGPGLVADTCRNQRRQSIGPASLRIHENSTLPVSHGASKIEPRGINVWYVKSPTSYPSKSFSTILGPSRGNTEGGDQMGTLLPNPLKRVS